MGRWSWISGYLGYILGSEFWAGKGYLCKLFRKSEVFLAGCISEIRINVGIGFWFGDLDLVCGKGLWISDI